jgi:co-chaperonin GroES (HSP10)
VSIIVYFFSKTFGNYNMKNIVPFLALCIAVVAVQSAIADSGSSTKSKVRVRNNTTATVGVAVNPSDALKASKTPEQFVAAGGVILNAGESHTFDVKVGDQTVVAGDAANINAFKSLKVKTKSNETLQVNVSQILK